MRFSLEFQEDGAWDTLRRNMELMSGKIRQPLPQARVYNNAAITLTTAVDTTLTFNSERWDEGNLHSTSANTGRLTAPITGLYSIGANVRFAANATGIRQVGLRLNGATFIAYQRTAAIAGGVENIVAVTTEYRLAAGDYVEVRVYQNSGGNLDVEVAGNYSPEFWMHRIGGYTNEGIA